MSDQTAPAPGQEDPSAAAGGGAGADPYKLHDHAMKASAELEAIATGLAHANAPENVTAGFTKMAEATRKLATSLSRAPAPPEKAPPARETMSSATNDLAAQAQRPR